MKEYIKKFDSASAADNYAIADIPFTTSVEASGQNLVCNQTGKKLVNVSGTIQIQSAGPEMVDLGLSVKWAKYNIGTTPGSTKESYYGNFYAWGEIETKSDYSWSTYKFGTSSPFSKYDTDGKTILEAVDDITIQTYGSNYRMPTEAELEELKALPNKWVTDFKGISGLNGRIFAKTQTELDGTFDDDTMLFIPAAGYFDGSSHDGTGSNCSLWSSSLDSGDPNNAWRLYFSSDYIYVSSDYRYCGFSVRVVKV